MRPHTHIHPAAAPGHWLGLLLVLVACGSVQRLPAGAASPQTGQPESTPAADTPDYSLTVALAPADTPGHVERRYGGQIVLWQPERASAVLALSRLSAAAVSEGALELNQGSFTGSGQLAWMNGMVSAWAGGSVSAWAGGMVSAWAGGTFAPVPQNTVKWQRLGLEKAQSLARNLGEDVTVAIIDSGLDLAHPAFQGSLVTPAQRWDYVGHDAVPQEEGVLGAGAYGHGTSVAGIVLQIAPRARLMPLRVLGPDGSGDVLDVAAAIARASKQGADVINLSLGSDVNSPAVASAIDAATAEGVFVVSSSGNTADQHITFPASVAHLDATAAGLHSLSVGSVDELDQKSAFSTYGAALELVAPGEAVYGPLPDQRLGAWSGTSMAAPMASGALALALGESLREDPRLLAERLKNRSINITRQGQNLAYDELLGDGRLSIADFLVTVLQ